MKKCEQYELYISAFIDNELDEEQQIELFEHLASCPNCRSHLKELKQIKEGTMHLKEYLTPPVELEYFWHNLYHKIERGISWSLIILGSLVLFITGLFMIVKEIWISNELSIILKISLLFLVSGSLLLLVSVVREKLFIRRFDKYKEIQK